DDIGLFEERLIASLGSAQLINPPSQGNLFRNLQSVNQDTGSLQWTLEKLALRAANMSIHETPS
ncbi:MAG: hypothetical protein KDI41_20400, partial [Pseudomonadales bacterium]|nr:hypothetical protein [Pseudomonadales bacterium]